jgi:hypothetical protein
MESVMGGDHDIYLEVPVLDQHKVFPTTSPNWACWYTSAYMVLLHRMGFTSIVNLDTLTRLFKNKGLGASEDAALAKELGLEHSLSSDLLPGKTPAAYCRAGSWQISFNDPDGGKVGRDEVQQFNSKVEWAFPIHYRRSTFDPPKVLQLIPNRNPFRTKY